MTIDQAIWASQHDWYADSMPAHGDNGYRVMCRGNLHEPEFIWFDDYNELRKWAGY